MKKSVIAMIAGLTAMAVQAEPEIKGTPSEVAAYLSDIPKVVTISGRSEIKIQADRAYVRVKASTEAKSLKEALNKNAALRQEIVEELKKNGIPEGNISGSKFSSQPQFGIFSDKAKSYKIYNTIKVLVADEAQLRCVASAIDTHEDAEYSGDEFEDSKETTNKQKAQTDACEAAVAKKKLYETQLGVTLTPQAFTEGDVQKQVPMSPQIMAYAEDASMANVKSAVYRQAASSDITQFGEIIYRAVVEVQYRVKSEK